MMIEAMREVLRVADTQDVDLSEADISYWLNLLATLNPDGHTSMCQDVLAGRPTEVETEAERGVKQKKAIVKGARLHLYPSGFNLYRCSRGVKRPEVEEMTEGEAQELIGGAQLTYEKTIAVKNGAGR